MDIGEKIGRLREINGLSQDALAEVLGLKRSTIAQIERGARKIWALDVRKLADYFNVPPGWFFDDNPNPPVERDAVAEDKITNLLLEIKAYLKNSAPGSRPDISRIYPDRPRTLKYISQPVGAGKTLADCPVEGVLEAVTNGSPTHAFMVRGKSMEPDIPDESLLMVKAAGLNWNLGWKDGDVCVVYLESTDEWTVKKVRTLNDGRLVLTGTDGKREIVDGREVRIQGVVEDVIREPRKIAEILESLSDSQQECSKESKIIIKGKLNTGPMKDTAGRPRTCKINTSLNERRVDELDKGAIEEKLDTLIELMKVQVNILEDVKKNAEQNEILAGVNYLLERGEISAEEAENQLKKAGVNPRKTKKI